MAEPSLYKRSSGSFEGVGGSEQTYVPGGEVIVLAMRAEVETENPVCCASEHLRVIPECNPESGRRKR